MILLCCNCIYCKCHMTIIDEGHTPSFGPVKDEMRLKYNVDCL